jgi:hypothetical protein
MTHFVGIYTGNPDPDLDALTELYVDNAGNGRVGLWGYKDPAGVICDVKVVSGSGRVTGSANLTGLVRAFELAGLTEGAQIQGFLGLRPFTAPLVVHRSERGDLGARNAARLASGDPRHVAYIDGAPVKTFPLNGGFGGFVTVQQMAEVNGLAVHITGGLISLAAQKFNAESRGASTHFTIDRDGNIAQYVAMSFMANAQGPGNRNYLSVEMVGRGEPNGACQKMTDKQINTLQKLYNFVYLQFPNPTWSLSSVYVGNKGALMGPGAAKPAQLISEGFVSRGDSSTGVLSVNEVAASRGLSCHYWLEMAAKPCPGAGIMGQLPQILGNPELRVPADAAYILPN